MRLGGFSSILVTNLNAVPLDVPSGTMFGFLGPNGAGKTTTIEPPFIESSTGLQLTAENLHETMADSTLGTISIAR